VSRIIHLSQPPAVPASDEETMAATRDRLVFRFFRLVEGEAEGRFAIAALVALVLAALIVLLTVNAGGP
jgi:hypothetical protein